MKKSISLALVMCMVLSLFAAFAIPAAAEEAPFADGDDVVIYCPSEDLAISAEDNVYVNKYGDEQHRLSGTEKENGAVFTVEVTDDGIYFLHAGKYLTSGATGSNLTLEATASDYSLWALEEADGGWYIKNLNAAYTDKNGNSKPQYIEYYYAFTTYSLDTSKAGIYTFQFIVQEKEDDDTTSVPEAGSTLTIEEAIALGESMEHDTYTDVKYYVTGVIESVYNAQYGNMYLVDDDGNRLTIYGTYSADGELRYDAMEVKPDKGDTVTIYGAVGNYNGNPQIKNGWIVNHIPGEDGDETPDPEADSTLTIEEAIALGASKTHNVYTTNKYYVTGVITEIYNEQYGNMKITDDAGNILTIYGTYSADGEVRFDSMETKPVVGDVVTVYGIIGQYNDVPQVKNGWITAINPEVEGDESDTSGEAGTPEMGDASIAVVVVVMIVAMAGVVVVAYRRRRA